VTMAGPVEIHPRAPAVEGGFFPYEVKAVPATPTHCRDCKLLLELLRRYAGLCKGCVAKRAKRRKAPRPMKLVRTFVRNGEKHLEVECGCGARRVMRQSTYNAQRPQSCKRCRLRAVAKHGFEAEYPRARSRRVFATRRDK
jgi:hypothetical protein